MNRFNSFPTRARPIVNQRKALRFIKREAKAASYRKAALSGGGKREVARRAGQIFCQRAIREYSEAA